MRFTSADRRELYRHLRRPPAGIVASGSGGDGMPESHIWQVYQELRRRGEDAEDYFLRSLRNLHRRRTLGVAELSTTDPDPEEHRQTDDPFLAELWRAYKKCIQQNRTGPAAQLLRDIEDQLVGAAR